MSEYIKREDIKNAIRERFNSLSDRVEINTVINMMPHIDIVKCKECRHSEYREDYDDYLCDEDGISVHEADWYCADGEREE